MTRMRSHTSEQQPLSCSLPTPPGLHACHSTVPTPDPTTSASGVLIRVVANRKLHRFESLMCTEATGSRCMCAGTRYLRNITIPSAFITKSDGQTLKDLFKKTGSAAVDDVYVVLDWNDVLPRAQRVGKVSMIITCPSTDGAVLLCHPSFYPDLAQPGTPDQDRYIHHLLCRWNGSSGQTAMTCAEQCATCRGSSSRWDTCRLYCSRGYVG